MTIKIGIGPGLAPPLSVDQYWHWVDVCEAGGIDSFWHSDQMLGPSPEPMTMLAALAAATKRMRIGTNALVITLRDPLLLAKQCATIDYLSNGRLLPVFGVGDAADPVWRATGRSMKGRGALANEAILLVRRLLSEATVSFEGNHFRYANVAIGRPPDAIPLWIGGDSTAAVERTAALGDGWLGGFSTPARAGAIVQRIKAALALNGRTIAPDHYGVIVPFRFGAADDPCVGDLLRRLKARRPDGQSEDALASLAIGDSRTIVAAFEAYVAAGISKFVAVPIVEDADSVIAQTRHLIDEILPAVETIAAPKAMV